MKRDNPGLTTIVLGRRPQPTIVYDTYWRFAAERQEIFHRRLEGDAQPWTHDPVLRQYKFTNAYRASDRVSQYLIRNVIYGPQAPTELREVFFRILLFKLFNRISTWMTLERAFGGVSWSSFDSQRYDRVLSEASAAGERLYSAAYIMPSGPRDSRWQGRKHRYHLWLIEKMMGDNVPERIADARTMEAGFKVLRAYPGIGDFLAYQFITDLNYSEIMSHSEMEFVVPGPGARDGLAKCFTSFGDYSERDVIKITAEKQAEEFRRLGLRFRNLWGRDLQLIDCQNLFCEVDKYSRVVHPEVIGRTGRTRIKQGFQSNGFIASVTFPPKWGLNVSQSTAAPISSPPHIQGSFDFP